MNPLQTAVGYVSDKTRDFFQGMKDDFNTATSFSDSSISSNTRRSSVARLGAKVIVVAVIGSVILSVFKTAMLITSLVAFALIGHDLAQISNNQNKPRQSTSHNPIAQFQMIGNQVRELNRDPNLDAPEAKYAVEARRLTENTCFPFMFNLTFYFLKAKDAYIERNKSNATTASSAPTRIESRRPSLVRHAGLTAIGSANHATNPEAGTLLL